ncbi:prostaglandin F synthase 1-like isoform 2-T5 [Thomomys bottae]
MNKLLSVKLSDGYLMPVLGLGTYTPNKVSKSTIKEAIQRAIDIGYRHIDSAFLYQNEEAIGSAIRKKIADGSVKRDDVFYTSKLWSTFCRPELVQVGLERSLKSLQLSYVDLYLIHFPVPLKAMEKCKDAGLVKSIGVSNFNRRQLERILNMPGLRHKPVCNQVECHPYLNQSKLLEFCKSRDIVMVAYAALGSKTDKEWVNKDNPVLLEDTVLNGIAEKHGRTPAQVALRYQVQRGLSVLAKSFNEKRMQENFQVFDFQLTPEDMKTLQGLNRNIRYFEDSWFSPHPNYPFSDNE